MGWNIQCNNSKCNKQTYAVNIVDLIDKHTDSQGWFVCEQCKKTGYIEKSFELQEPGEKWEPFLRGVLRLGKPGDTYQPFVFLVSYSAKGKSTGIWFSYYKDLRSSGGKLKLGYGPGGPPVLDTKQITSLLQHLLNQGLMNKNSIDKLIK